MWREMTPCKTSYILWWQFQSQDCNHKHTTYLSSINKNYVKRRRLWETRREYSDTRTRNAHLERILSWSCLKVRSRKFLALPYLTPATSTFSHIHSPSSPILRNRWSNTLKIAPANRYLTLLLLIQMLTNSSQVSVCQHLMNQLRSSSVSERGKLNWTKRCAIRMM